MGIFGRQARTEYAGDKGIPNFWGNIPGKSAVSPCNRVKKSPREDVAGVPQNEAAMCTTRGTAPIIQHYFLLEMALRL